MSTSIRTFAFLLALASLSQPAAAAGDAKEGEKVFKKCAICHTLEPGGKKVGPSLHGVFGRTSGTLDGFNYSKAMKEAAIVWSEETIDQYLADPKGFIPKNKMIFPGLKKADERADVIAYLKSVAP